MKPKFNDVTPSCPIVCLVMKLFTPKQSKVTIEDEKLTSTKSSENSCCK